MKVIITGGSGLLGRALNNLFEKKGIPTLNLTRSKMKAENFIQSDYSLESLNQLFYGYDSIVHLAASRGPSDRIEYFHGDEVITQNIYEAARKNNIKNIVYASSISTYSDLKLLPWKESDVAEPSSLYGISKLSCEMIGNWYNQRYSMAIKNLRLAHLFGFNEKNNYMINLFMRQAFNRKTLQVKSGAHSKREFLYVKDAAKACLVALKQRAVRGTFNIGNTTSRLTNLEVAQLINSVFNNDSLMIDESDKDATLPSFMDLTKANQKLHFTCDYDFVGAMSEIYELMKELEYVPIFY